ncbi:MAG: hypothetical protein P8P49_09720 [Opitutales bacterium]|nr:hypothetical protein [Opitutales bacterium]
MIVNLVSDPNRNWKPADIVSIPLLAGTVIRESIAKKLAFWTGSVIPFSRTVNALSPTCDNNKCMLCPTTEPSIAK